MSETKNTKLWLGVIICSIAALFYCYEYLLRIIPGVMEAELREAFGHISATSFGTLSAYYYFAYTPMQLPAGMMMDKLGPRRLLLLACLLCALGSWLFTIVDYYFVAALGRFLVGFGSAFAFVGVLSLAVAWLPPAFFSMVAGLVTTLGMVGAMIGQVGMSHLVENKGWQYVLHLGPILGLILCIIMFFGLQDKPASKIIRKKQNKTETEPKLIVQLIKVLTDGQIWLVGLIGSLLYLSLSVFAEVWGKSYLMVAHHMDSIEASSAISMVFFGWAIGGPLLGLIADMSNRRLTTIMLGALLATASISAVLYLSNLSFFQINGLLFFYGFFCSAEVIVFAIAKDTSKSNFAGTVLASVNMIIMLGGVIFQPLVGKFLDFFWNGQIYNHMRIYSPSDYQLVLSFLPLSLLCVSIAVFFVRERRG